LLVSVIIPAYNAGRTLEHTINNVLQLSYPNFEVIIVDNNSTDNTASIISNAVKCSSGKIRSFMCSKQGASAARNLGLTAANGTWIQFLDADDTLDPRKVSHQLESIAPGTQWVIGGYRTLGAGLGGTENLPHEDPWKGLVYQYRIGCTHANLYRKTALERSVNDYLREHRPEYWQANQAYFLAALLRALRILATHDLSEAARQFERLRKVGKVSLYLPDQPILSQQLLSAYRAGGFTTVERLRLAAASVVPSRIKGWLRR